MGKMTQELIEDFFDKVSE